MAKLKEKPLLRQPHNLKVGDLVKLHPSVRHIHRAPGTGIILETRFIGEEKVCTCFFSPRKWDLRAKAMQYTSRKQFGSHTGIATVDIKDEHLIFQEEAPGSWTGRLTQTEMSLSRFSRLGKRKR